MNVNCEKILNNTINYNQIMSDVLPKGLSEDMVYHKLLDRTAQAREIMANNVEIIGRYFEPYFKSPEMIDDIMAKDFEELALELYKLNYVIDVGFAAQLHDALYRRGKSIDDVNAIIKHAYWCGLIYMQWTKVFNSISTEYFNDVLNYKDKYFTSMNDEARMYFNRALGNRYVVVGQRRSFKDVHIKEVEADFRESLRYARDFWNDPKVRELNPEFPWDGFINNSYANTVSWLDQLRDEHEDDEELIVIFTDAVNHLFEGKDSPTHSNSIAYAQYMILSKEYYNNEITLDELIEGLKRLADDVDEDDYNDDTTARIFIISGVYQHYLSKNEAIDKEIVDQETERLFNRSFRYYHKNHEDSKRKKLNSQFINVVRHYISYESYGKEIFNTLLKATSFSHLPTYAHSVMVGELMVIMTDYFLEYHPEVFIGLPGLNTKGDVLLNRTRLLDLVKRSGYAHDVGKIDYVDTVAICSRKISDREFDVIKNHTVFGTELFSFTFNECVCDVILGHHKFYNGKGGYPEIFDNNKSRYKFIIDMCSIADVLDAGTDEIGRSYAKGKTVDELIVEIQTDAAIKYSPLFAKVLDDPILYDAIKEHIENGRKSIYYRAYLDLFDK